MAVYTHVARSDLEGLIAAYDIGALVDFEGAPDGVENTTYFVQTSAASFVLTLFEKRVRESDLPFFLELARHLQARGFPCAEPITARNGGALQRICGRPAALFGFVPGAPRLAPGASDCAALGGTLADLHRAGSDFGGRRANDLGPAGWRRLAAATADRAGACAPGLDTLIRSEIAYLDARWPRDLPAGAIHADLFPDNVFFSGDRISGVIDFYFACTDYLAYDIAICLNSWANVAGAWRHENAAALLRGYQSKRALTPEEIAALPALLRGSALRFLLTRLYDWIHRIPGALVNVKDPLEYRDLLQFHRNPD